MHMADAACRTEGWVSARPYPRAWPAWWVGRSLSVRRPVASARDRSRLSTSLRGLARRALFSALMVVGGLALTPALAQASHLRGGYFTAQITAGDHLVGAVNYTARNGTLTPTCTVGATPTTVNWILHAPDGTTVPEMTNAAASQCLANASTYSGTFDIDLATAFTSHDTDGMVKLVFGLCCRVGGIVNMTNSASDSLAFETGIQRVAGTATAAPDISSNAALGIPIGYPYSQNLNVSDPNGGLTYTSLAGTGANYATSDIVAFSNAGQVTIPATVTSGMTDGAFYVYGVQATDSVGNYAQREVTMTATAVTSTPPAFSGLPSTLSLPAGTTQVINFSASSSVMHALSISTSALPSWISFSTSPGSPATGTLTISPPGNLVVQTVGLNVDAIDNTGAVAIDTSANLQISVTVPAPTTSIDSQPSAIDNNNTPVFTFSSPTGVSFQCNLDSAGWNACASPDQLSTLADGSHTFSVRGVDGSSQVDPNPPVYTWTVDSHTPAAPGLTGQPSDPTNQTSASIGITGETGATFSCTFDSATPVACTSPFTASGLADGAHTLSVTQTDLAGTTSPPVIYTWTVDAHTPSAPAITAQPAQHSSTSSVSFTGEHGSSFSCKIDGGSYAPCASPFAPTGLADGPHTFSVTQTDASGTTSSASSAIWVLDTTAPAAPLIIGGPVGDTPDSTATYTFTGEDGATFSCRLDGAIWVSCSPGQSYTGLSVGNHRFEVSQTDLAGNTSPPATADFKVGSTDPLAPRIASVIVATDVQSTPDGFAVGCRLDHGSLHSCTVRAYVVVSDGHGHHKLVLIATGKTTVGRPAGVRQSVEMTLNATGRRLLGRSLGGVHIVIRSSAKAFGSKRAFPAHTRIKIHPVTRFLEPNDGMFNTNSATPLAPARRFLSFLATHLSDVKQIHCIGNTDSRGTATSNYKLGYARAQAVCSILRATTQLHDSRFTISSFGETRPRATNTTVGGRALNRRVEIIVTFHASSRIAR
jgi:hypothetical protein